LISLNSGSESCLWAISSLAELQKCLEFKSTLYKPLNSKTPDSAISITLNQYFEYPIELEIFKSRLVKTYGQPNVSINSGISVDPKSGMKAPVQNYWADEKKINQIPFGKDPIFGPTFVLIWSSELNNVQPSDRIKLLDPKIMPSDIGVTKPVLRVFGKTEGNAVRGMEVNVYDPIMTKIVDYELNLQSHQPSLSDGDQIKLR
jgi:hypothetical protein